VLELFAKGPMTTGDVGKAFTVSAGRGSQAAQANENPRLATEGMKDDSGGSGFRFHLPCREF
jgi:hypothetical protein